MENLSKKEEIKIIYMSNKYSDGIKTLKESILNFKEIEVYCNRYDSSYTTPYRINVSNMRFNDTISAKNSNSRDKYIFKANAYCFVVF